LYVKFYYKSFYKLSPLHGVRDYNFICGRNTINSSQRQLIYGGDDYAHMVIFILLVHSSTGLHPTARLTRTHFPKKKNNVIFLRAPYKNKLARLNIVRVLSSSVLTARVNNPSKLNHNISRE
jgi:hypothetical protein